MLNEMYGLSLTYMFGLERVLYCNIVTLLAIMGDIEYTRLPVPVVSKSLNSTSKHDGYPRVTACMVTYL